MNGAAVLPRGSQEYQPRQQIVCPVGSGDADDRKMNYLEIITDGDGLSTLITGHVNVGYFRMDRQALRSTDTDK